MANRRLVNLVMTDCKNCMFSLHRMDLSKLLFYPSTAEAEAVGRRVDKGKPPKIGKLRLPPPVMGFEPFPAGDPLPTVESSWLGPDRSIFVLLHGRHDEASRILFTSIAGQATMYDVDSRSVISVPDLIVPTRMKCRDHMHMPKAIVTGAGAGEERVYVMRADGHFEVLDFSGVDKIRTSFPTNWRRSLVWQSLPPLPVVVDPYISSFTVVDSDRIICVSASSSCSSSHEQNNGTFCFDTVSRQWWQAGDWCLPFQGRAEYVPELDTWLGFSSIYPHYLCVADLSGVAMAPRRAPTPQHVWEDFEPPPMETISSPNSVAVTRSVNWKIPLLFLVNLGSGRFCVAKVALGQEVVSASWTVERHEGPNDMFTVLTGVEVIRGGRDGELRMVKHKSRKLVHPGLELACVL